MAENKVQRGILYLTNGKVAYVKPVDGKKFELKELQKAVGGFIESLIPSNAGELKNFKQMFCNEEALLHPGFTPNPHTWSVVHADTYKRSGYPPSWRVQGNIIAIVKTTRDDPRWAESKTVFEPTVTVTYKEVAHV